MKKLLLLLVAIILLAAAGFSQTFYKVIEADYSEYTYGKWNVESTTYPDNMYVIMNKSSIKITNESESSFITYGDPIINKYITHKSYTWDAYDKNGNSCSIILKVYSDAYNENKYNLCIVYGMRAFEYYFNQR